MERLSSLTHFSKTTNLTETIINIDSYYSNINLFWEGFEQYASIKRNNRGRVEFAISFTNNINLTESINNFFSDIIPIAVSKIQVFNFSPILEIAKFHLNGLKVYFSLLMAQYNQIKNHQLVLEILDKLHFFCFCFKTFFSGRRYLTGPLYPKLSYYMGRVIYPETLPIFSSFIKMQQYQQYKKDFFDFLGISNKRFPDIIAATKSPQIQISKNPGCMCIKCHILLLTDDKIKSSHLHPCTINQFDASNIVSLNDKRAEHILNDNLNKLDAKQKEVFDFVKKNPGKNIFITGVAGSGKSSILRILIPTLCKLYGMKSILITSPISIAAANVYGTTIHKAFFIRDLTQIKNLNFEEHYKQNKRKFDELMFDLKYIIIDEVSLLTYENFERLNDFLKFLQEKINSTNKDKAFGGISIILCGDILQLPPISEELTNIYKQFFIQSPVFINSGFYVAYLTDSHRHSAGEYLDYLNKLRVGNSSEAVLKYFNENLGSSFSQNTVLSFYKTCIHNAFVPEKEEIVKFKRHVENGTFNSNRYKLLLNIDDYNNKVTCKANHNEIYFQNQIVNRNILMNGEENEYHVIAIQKKEVFQLEEVRKSENSQNIVFNCADSINGTTFDLSKGFGSFNFNNYQQKNIIRDALSNCKLKNILSLREGMKIKFVSNSIDPFIYSNQFGIIKKFDLALGIIEILPLDSFNVKCIYQIRKIERISMNVYNCNGILVTRTQFPIQPYTIDLLPSLQGCSISFPTIFSNGRFYNGSNMNEGGFLYTLLTRFTDKKYIFPLFKIEKDDIRANSMALVIDKYHREESSTKHFIHKVNYMQIMSRGPKSFDCVPKDEKSMKKEYDSLKLFVHDISLSNYLSNLPVQDMQDIFSDELR